MQNLNKNLATLLGVVFLLIGVAGFFVDGMLLWFEVDTLHNVVHLLSGAVALFCASKGDKYAHIYLIVFGIVYAIVTVVGFAMQGDILGLFHSNEADNYLHGAIALLCLGVAFTHHTPKPVA